MPTLNYKGNYSKQLVPTAHPIPTEADQFMLGIGILLDNNSHYLVLHAEVKVLNNATQLTESFSVNYNDPNNGGNGHKMVSEPIGSLTRTLAHCQR